MTTEGCWLPRGSMEDRRDSSPALRDRNKPHSKSQIRKLFVWNAQYMSGKRGRIWRLGRAISRPVDLAAVCKPQLCRQNFPMRSILFADADVVAEQFRSRF